LIWLHREANTHLDIVTPHWLQLLDAVVANPNLRALPHLRWTIVGGESFSYQHTHQWYEVIQSPGRLNNIYGPTGATVNATEIEVQPQLSTGKVPIGKPQRRPDCSRPDRVDADGGELGGQPSRQALDDAAAGRERGTGPWAMSTRHYLRVVGLRGFRGRPGPAGRAAPACRAAPSPMG
jgi:hypothetical protein